MQPVALHQGYRTANVYAAELGAGAKRIRGGAPKECKQGQELLSTIHKDRERLSPKMRNLADFCLKNAHGLHRMRIQDLARQTDNIDASVVRFAKRYGYEGFKDFKLAFLQEPVPKPISTDGAAMPHRPLGMHAALWELDVASSGALALKALVETVAFQQAVRWLSAAKHIGLLARSSDDQPITMHLESLLNRLNKATVVLSEEQYLQNGLAEPVELLLGVDIGLHGRSANYRRALPTAPTPCVRITASPLSAYSTDAMSHFGLVSSTAGPGQLALASIALINALCAALLG